MYVCICNPFTDSHVREHLGTLDNVTRIKDVYESCSGGKAMNCGTCACELKKMVDDHNGTIAVSRISAAIEHVIQHNKKEPV